MKNSNTRYVAITCLLAALAVAASAAPPASPAPEQLPARMHEPVKEVARISVGHADDKNPTRAYDITGRDQRAIQAAIDFVAALDAGDAPRIVEIGPGRFLMRDSLHLRSQVTLRGTPGKTVLVKALAAVSKLALDGDYGEEQITLADPAGFDVGSGVAIWDDNVRYFHITVARITGRTATPGTFTIDVPLRGDSVVKRNGSAATVFPVISGYDVRGTRLEHLEIDGSRDTNPFLDGCRGGGIYFSRGHAAAIHGCTVHHYNGDGISIDHKDTDNLLRGNTIRANACDGILIRDERPQAKP